MVKKIADRFRKLNYSSAFYEHLAFVTVGFFSGLICCAYAYIFSHLEKIATEFYLAQPYYLFLLSPVLLVMSFLMVQKFAPGAFGSGIPQVMVCISDKAGKHLERFLGLKVLVVKIFSSVIGIIAGGAIGREGPSIQVSASIGYTLSKILEKLKISVKRDQLILAGSAGGLAAAFNTPIGGIVYAIEELSHDHIRSYKTVLLMSVLIAGFTAQLLMGNYLYLGYPRVINVITLKVVFAIVVVSFSSGVMGGVFSSLLIRLIEWRRSFSMRYQIGLIMLVGILLSIIFYEFGERMIFSGKESINFVLFDILDVPKTEFIFRFISPLLSSMSGIAGGIFAPSLSAGAALGGMMAGIFDVQIRGLLGLVGMIGFLNGVTKAPITSFVLVLEMTDRHSSIFPMMLSAIFSHLGSYLISHESFYERSAKRIMEGSHK